MESSLPSRLQQINPLPQNLKFIDIYHGEAIVNFDEVKAAGFAGVFHKASETFSVDPKFRSRWSIIKNEGLIRGAYHFFHPNHVAKDQADHFVNLVGKDLLPSDKLIVDWEVRDGELMSVQKEDILNFLQEVMTLTKRLPWVYSYASYLEEAKCGPEFEKFPLWIAQYSQRKSPIIPKPWKTWDAWQFTGDGKGMRCPVPGVSSKCDVSVFNGTLADFKALGGPILGTGIKS